MKVALVYDRVNKWGGAERVLLTLHEMFPKAPLFTSVYASQKTPWAKIFPQVISSFLQKLPFMYDKHEILMPLMPLAFESFDFSEYDLVISVTSEAAKGIIVKPPTKHICYCLTPTRYLWSHYATYFNKRFLKTMARPIVSYLRYWDRIASLRPDRMIAISTTVQKRIKKYYNRESAIVHPPVDIETFNRGKTPYTTSLGSDVENREERIEKMGGKSRSKFFLVVSRLVSYKRVDLAIKACNELDLPLVVVGFGSEEARLKALAGNNIKFVKNLTDKQLASYYQKARALIFPQEEDFGLVAVEAQASGTPVIAYKKGGSLDTVIDGKTGVFFDKQDVDSLTSAIQRFEKLSFNSKVLLNNAKRFSKENFVSNFLSAIGNDGKQL